MADIGVRIKAIADVDEAASKFNALSNSIATSGQKNANISTPGDNGQQTSTNAQAMLRDLRDQFLKDTRLGGYTDEINQKFNALLDSLSSNRTADVQAPAQGGETSMAPTNAQAMLRDLRDQFLKDTRLGGYSKIDELNEKFGPLISSIFSSDRAMGTSIKEGNLGATKDYAELQLSLRNQFLKDTQLAGYKDVKLDSKPLETAIQNLTAIMNQMIAEGKSKEAKGYGEVLKSFQGQLTTENSEDQRTRMAQDQQTRFLRGLTRFLGQGQNFIGQAGSGNIAGAALGAAGGATDLLPMIKNLPAPVLAGAGIAAAVVGLGAVANKLSEQWEKVMQPSMGLAASLGELGSDAKRNSAAFKEVFHRATDADVLHGYKLEEGLQLANDLSKMGVRSGNVYQAESQVFGYQRATDADRGLLSRAAAYSQRYRAGENVLGYAYGGIQESGMQSGQYQEYLNATLRIFEEGLSKGVVKGFAEITRTQNMLAQIGETWKGETGMERRQNINSAIEGSYNLQSDYDVIMYRAAQSIAGPGAGYGDIAKLLDQGIDGPDGDKLLRSIGDTIKQVAGDGEAGVMQTMRMFNLNYTAAEEFFNAISGKNPDFGRARDVLKDPESLDVKTTEQELLTVTEQIRRDIVEFGQNFTEAKLGVISGLQKITNLMAGNRTFAASSAKTMDVMTQIGVTGERARRYDQAFEKAYTMKDQPDDDENGLGDNAERAKKLQDAMASMSEAARYFLAQNPNNVLFTALDRFKKGEDFTEDNTRQALSAIDLVNSVIGKQSPEDLRRGYFEDVSSSIPQNGNTRKDDELRWLFTERSSLIPDSIMTAIEESRLDNSRSGRSIDSNDIHGINTSEVALIYNALKSFAERIPELAAALKDASTFVIRDER
jgi:hypothetical protein